MDAPQTDSLAVAGAELALPYLEGTEEFAAFAARAAACTAWSTCAAVAAATSWFTAPVAGLIDVRVAEVSCSQCPSISIGCNSVVMDIPVSSGRPPVPGRPGQQA